VSRKHSAEIEALIVLSLFVKHSKKFPSAFGGHLVTLNTLHRIEKRRDLPPNYITVGGTLHIKVSEKTSDNNIHSVFGGILAYRAVKTHGELQKMKHLHLQAFHFPKCPVSFFTPWIPVGYCWIPDGYDKGEKMK
jgi:hypothetical protein